jgi:hypothetical protein
MLATLERLGQGENGAIPGLEAPKLAAAPSASHPLRARAGRQPVEAALPSSDSLPELLMECVTAPLRITNYTYWSARSFVSVG